MRDRVGDKAADISEGVWAGIVSTELDSMEDTERVKTGDELKKGVLSQVRMYRPKLAITYHSCDAKAAG